MGSSQPNIDPNGWYRPKEAAELLGISESTLWRDSQEAVGRGKIKCTVTTRGNGYRKYKGIDLISYWKTK